MTWILFVVGVCAIFSAGFGVGVVWAGNAYSRGYEQGIDDLRAFGGER